MGRRSDWHSFNENVPETYPTIDSPVQVRYANGGTSEGDFRKLLLHERRDVGVMGEPVEQRASVRSTPVHSVNGRHLKCCAGVEVIQPGGSILWKKVEKAVRKEHETEGFKRTLLGLDGVTGKKAVDSDALIAKN
jgi:hypothetical protein